MLNDAATADAIEWQNVPLCRQYLAAFFEGRSLRLRTPKVDGNQTVHWAVGLLADGQHEVLGVWPEGAAAETCWGDVFGDLKVRGVEEIQFIASDELTCAELSVRSAFPRATVLPLMGQVLRRDLMQVRARDRAVASKALDSLRASSAAYAARSALAELKAASLGAKYPSLVADWDAALERLGPFYALAPRLRRIMRSADSVVERLNRKLGRAVASQGCFADADAATSFLLEALSRAERSLARPAEPVTLAERRAARAPVGLGIEAVCL